MKYCSKANNLRTNNLPVLVSDKLKKKKLKKKTSRSFQILETRDKTKDTERLLQ